jgi:hypothetical protein
LKKKLLFSHLLLSLSSTRHSSLNMSKYNIIYFPSAGNAQAGRIALAAGNADWTNEFVTQATWGGVKGSGRAPFGQAPFLEVTEADGSKFTIAQGHAITRFVASRLGKERSAKDNAIIDSLTERAAELKSSFGGAVHYALPADEKAVKTAAW